MCLPVSIVTQKRLFKFGSECFFLVKYGRNEKVEIRSDGRNLELLKQ
jgi:hypothetical protein